MLSTNSILRQGRFRVSQIIASSPSHSIYEAQDNLAAKPVLLCENAGLTPFGNSNPKYRGNGILEIADRFDENGRAYLVTEPLSGPGPWDLGNDRRDESAVAKLCERLRPIVDSVGQIRRHFPNAKLIEISPVYFRESVDGLLKLAFFERAQILGSNPSESPFLPLEAIWETLDFASQKAISADYDEASLALLDAAPDHRTDLYSIGAVFYSLLSGTQPRSALERAIVMLDSGSDPLVPVDQLNPHVPKRTAEELTRMLSLKRELRDDSLEAALMQSAMPKQAAAPAPPAPAASMPPAPTPVSAPPVATPTAPVVASAPVSLSDDLDDLLEIPVGPPTVVAEPVQQPVAEVAEAAPVEPVGVMHQSVETPEAVEAPVPEHSFESIAPDQEIPSEVSFAEEKAVEEEEESLAASEVHAYSAEHVEEESAEEVAEEEEVEDALPDTQPQITFSHSEEVIEEHPEPFIDEVAPAEPALEDEEETVEDDEHVLAHAPSDEPYGGVHTRVETAAAPVVDAVHTKSPSTQASYEEAELPSSFASVEPAGSGGMVKIIGIGAAAAIVLAVGIWIFSTMGGTAAKPQATAPQTAPVTSSVAAETSAEPSAGSQPVAISAEQPSGQENPTAAAPEKAVADTRDAKPRPQIAEAKPAKPETKPAAAATPAKAKKSVTVDDLINDN